MEKIIVVIIFIATYVALGIGKIHRVVVALSGAALILLFHILNFDEAFYSPKFGVDYDVIVLLLSMMIIVNITKQTGIFEWVAVKAVKASKAKPYTLMILFVVITAVISAFLDNVTTVLFIAPITLFISETMDLPAVPFLISEALASNIGGTATLIGDPPNIMIASKAQLGFMDFINHLTPVVIIILIVYILTLKLMFSHSFKYNEKKAKKILEMDEKKAIKDPKLLKKALIVLFGVVIGFFIHGMLGLEPAVVALIGATLMLGISDTNIHEMLEKIEWTTLFFFGGLFIIVGSMVKVGIIQYLSQKVLDLTHAQSFLTSTVILWFSAFVSAFVDNIPYVATMNPLIANMAPTLAGNPALDPSSLAALHSHLVLPIWIALSLGGCLGGNGTLVGATANVVVSGISEKAGHKITFGEFIKYGMPIMIESVAIGFLYIWLRYYVLKIF